MNLDIRVDMSIMSNWTTVSHWRETISYVLKQSEYHSIMSNPPYVFSRRQHYLLCHIVQSEHSVKFQMFIISLTDIIVSSPVPGLFWIIYFLTDHAGIPGTVCK